MESKPEIGGRESRFQPYPLQRTEGEMNLKQRRDKNERVRNQSINDAFGHLQSLIPFVPEPEDRKLPRIKTLRLAIRYIRFLNDLLNGSPPSVPQPYSYSIPALLGENYPPQLSTSEFAKIVASEIQTKNSYSERAGLGTRNVNNTPVHQTPPPYPFGVVNRQMVYLSPFTYPYMEWNHQ